MSCRQTSLCIARLNAGSPIVKVPRTKDLGPTAHIREELPPMAGYEGIDQSKPLSTFSFSAVPMHRLARGEPHSASDRQQVRSTAPLTATGTSAESTFLQRSKRPYEGIPVRAHHTTKTAEFPVACREE